MIQIEWPRTGRARKEFERFVADGGDELLRTGYLVVWDLAEAEDLVQETLVRVARKWPRVRRMEHPIAAAVTRVAARSELIDALGTLAPRQRAVLVLRYFADTSEADLAETLGCSVGTVKSTASRGLARLQEQMREQEPSYQRSRDADPTT